MTERTVDAYAEDGRLRVIDEESADALLQLEVVSVEDRPFTYTAAEQTEQYRFTVEVAAELVRAVDGEDGSVMLLYRDETASAGDDAGE